MFDYIFYLRRLYSIKILFKTNIILKLNIPMADKMLVGKLYGITATASSPLSQSQIIYDNKVSPRASPDGRQSIR